jgi:hypothetical protein
MVQQAAAAPVTTSEVIILTMPPGNWNGALATLVSVSANYSPSASGTAIVFRVRQGNALTGTLVGVPRTSTVANPNSYELGFEVQDASAFGQAQQGGQYCVTAQGTGAGGTLNIITMEQETVAPIS